MDPESPDQSIEFMTPVGTPGITLYSLVAVVSRYKPDRPFSFVTKARLEPSWESTASSTSQGMSPVIYSGFRVVKLTFSVVNQVD